MAGRRLACRQQRMGGACVVLLSVVAAVSLPCVADGADPALLTVERLVAEPHLTGTAPTSPAWSPDSQWLAFRWNDAARSNMQLWLTDRSGGPPERLTGADEQSVSEIAWTPDSQAIVFLQNGDLWLLELADQRLQQITRNGGNKSELGVSPDGQLATYLAGGDLWAVVLRDGTIVRLTEVGVAGLSNVQVGRYSRPEAEVGPGIWGGPTYAWSPDARYIAVHYVDRRQQRKVPFPYYLADETLPNVVRRGYPGDANEARHVGLLRFDDRHLELLPLPEPEHNQVVGFAWSPDGRLLIDSASDTAADRWLDIVEPDSNDIRRIWHLNRPSRIYTSFASAWHPDGRQVLFSSDIEDRYGLYRLDPETGSHERLSMPSHDLLGEFSVIPDADAVFYKANDPDPSEQQVFRIAADGGEARRITSLAGTNNGVPSPDGSRLAILYSADASPPELYLAHTGERELRRLTTSPPEEFRQRSWTSGRYVSFPSRADDFTLHARILEPAVLEAGRRHPVVLGPVYSNTVRNRWSGRYSAVQQLLVDNGYIVVQVDIRGSTGYGRDFREAFLTDFAGDDLEDLASAVDYLKTLQHVDPDRIGIWGSSYGGTLTIYSLLKNPGLFRAGVAAAAAVDPRFFGPDDVAIVRDPTTHPEIFERLATYDAGMLEDHLLIIHGMQDQVVPFKTTAVLAEELMRQGKDFEFAFAPGATHSWTTEPHHARYLLGRLLSHFNRYLKDGPE
jgi:dipeptidyl-peptidase-4